MAEKAAWARRKRKEAERFFKEAKKEMERQLEVLYKKQKECRSRDTISKQWPLT